MDDPVMIQHLDEREENTYEPAASEKFTVSWRTWVPWVLCGALDDVC